MFCHLKPCSLLLAGLGESFGMVPIPNHIRMQLFVLGIGAFAFNYLLEHVSPFCGMTSWYAN